MPGCNCKVAAITSKNMRKSKMYCEAHTNGVEVKCYKCNKKMIVSCSDFMKIYPNVPRCKQCQLNELNKTTKMREQAGNLGRKLFQEDKGMFSKESKEKANIVSHTKEICKIREENKRINGFYNEGIGYQKGLEKWKKSGQTSEAHAKQNITRWNDMNDKDKEKEIERLKLIGFAPSFKEENGIKYYFDKGNSHYIPWEEYKIRFNRKRLTKDIEIFINSIKSLDIFKPKYMGHSNSYDLDDIIKIYPTFRSRDSQDWSDARQAFEQSLIENNIDWFCYVKFYIDKMDKIRPLVVGKSGSLNVNPSGFDLSFSTDIDDGPARRFLKENGYQWYITQIAICSFNDEIKALKFEKEIALRFNLFQS